MELLVEIKQKNMDEYIKMSTDFYTSPAVLFAVKEDHFVNTVKMADSPYVDLYYIMQEQKEAGYVNLSKTYSTEAGGMVLLIEEIYVKSEFQNKGIGSKVMQEILNCYSDYSRIRLEVCQSNKCAIKLYEKLGFKKLDYIQYIK